MKNIWFFLSGMFLLTVSYAQGDILQRSELDPELFPFYHGVASGDPTPDKVIIWTRVTPDSPMENIEVQWRIAKDTTFNTIVASGTTSTNETQDNTVKVDVAGLEANTWYYYEFTALDHNSIIGRTKTAPSGGVGQLRFATVSCSNYPTGYFNAYQKIVERNDIDAVLHLGDYIYEGGSDNDGYRDVEPDHEILDLADYRLRHSVYKLDSMLRKLHQQYPFITTWDDHESANDAYRDGAENHTPATEGPWEARKSSAVQAYEEWMPIRLPEPAEPGRIFRKLSYGGLADIFVLDTRLYDRDKQSSNVNNPNRHIIGPVQLEWLSNALASSTATWKIIAQQVMVAPLTPFGLTLNTDQWDGYTADRKRLYDFIQASNIDNVVFLTGDIHTAWANDLPYNTNAYNGNTGAGSVAVEFVCTSITSNSSPIPIPAPAYDIIKTILPHIKFTELYKKGYSLLDITDNKTTNSFYFVSGIAEPTATQEFAEAWCVNEGETWLKKCTETTMSDPQQYQAPPLPRPLVTTPVKDNTSNLQVLGAYPNPFINQVMLEFNLFTKARTQVSVVDMTGKVLFLRDLGTLSKGLHIEKFSLKELPVGTYDLCIDVDGKKSSRKMVKM